MKSIENFKKNTIIAPPIFIKNIIFAVHKIVKTTYIISYELFE